MFTKLFNPRKYFHNEKGMALVTVLIVSTALAMVGSAHLAATTHEAGLVNEQVQATQALYAAETGVNYARQQLTTADNWVTTNWVGDIADGNGGTVTVDFTATNPGTITSTSTIQGNTVQLDVNVGGTPSGDGSPFNQAACGCSSLTLSLAVGDNVGVDSYIYSGVTRIAGNSGDVGCNGNVDLGGASVYGDINAGGDLEDNGLSSVSGQADLGGAALTVGLDSRVHGGINPGLDPPPEPCDCTAIDVDALVLAYDEPSEYNNDELGVSTSFQLTHCHPVTFTAGTYYFTKFKIAGMGRVIIDSSGGEVIFIFAGNTGPFQITGNGISNLDDNVSNLKIYSNFVGTDDDTDEGKIKVAGNGSFSGTIYAPNANIWLAGNGDISGAIVGDNVRISENAQLHYDENLPNTSEPVDGGGTTMTVQINSWSQN